MALTRDEGLQAYACTGGYLWPGHDYTYLRLDDQGSVHRHPARLRRLDLTAGTLKLATDGGDVWEVVYSTDGRWCRREDLNDGVSALELPFWLPSLAPTVASARPAAVATWVPQDAGATARPDEDDDDAKAEAPAPDHDGAVSAPAGTVPLADVDVAAYLSRRHRPK